MAKTRDVAEMAVVVCSDRNLFWQAAFFLARSLASDREHRLDHYLYCSEPLDDRFRDVLGDRVKVIEKRAPEVDERVGISSHLTTTALLRIVALEELCPIYPQVAYSDVDVFLRWGSFAELIPLAGHDRPLAAVRDRSLWGDTPERWVSRNYFPSLPDGVMGQYFNSGILIANGPVYLEQEISPRALAFLRDHPEKCHYSDQSALNAAVNGDWLELSPSWNWQANMRYDHLIPLRNPRLVHFTGPVKPWRDRSRRFDEVYFFAMATWLEANGMQDILDALPDRRFHASRERMRTRMLKEGHDPMAMREAAKAYLNRTDFADAAIGLQVYGWDEG